MKDSQVSTIPIRATGIARRLDETRPGLVDTLIAAAVLVALSVQFVVPRIPEAPPVTWWSYGLTAIPAVALVWRRRWPLVVLIVTNVPMWLNKNLDGVGQPLPYAGLIAVYTVAALAPRWQHWVMHGLAVIVIPTAVLANTGELREYLFTFFVYVSAYVLGRLAVARREQTRALRDRAAELERANAAEARQAAGAERARIAREMHDILSHTISLIVVQAEAGPLTVRSDPARAEAAFDAIAETGRRSMGQLRRMLGVLADNEAGPDNRPAPGLADLPELLSHVESTGSRVGLTESGEPVSLSDDVQLAVYRIVQEALTNVVKHADARDATVGLAWGPTELTVSVTDDGSAERTRPRPDSGGRGLTNMRQRAAVHGGTVETGPGPSGRGFRVVARFPLGTDPAEAGDTGPADAAPTATDSGDGDPTGSADAGRTDLVPRPGAAEPVDVDATDEPASGRLSA